MTYEELSKIYDYRQKQAKVNLPNLSLKEVSEGIRKSIIQRLKSLDFLIGL